MKDYTITEINGLHKDEIKEVFREIFTGVTKDYLGEVEDALFLVMTGKSLSSISEIKEEEYDRGYDEGKEDFSQEQYDNGYDSGYDSGYTDGEFEGSETSYNSGYEKGTEDANEENELKSQDD